MVFDLSEGADRSLMQEDNPHIVFSDVYSNLLSFSYAEDSSIQKNFAYIFGQGKGDERKRTTYCEGDEPTYLDRYELYVDADDISETDAKWVSKIIKKLRNFNDEKGGESHDPD